MQAPVDKVLERRRETRLAIPRVEAERRLLDQIEQGKALLSVSSSFDAGNFRRDQFRRWDDYNVSMLRWMFTNNSFEESYSESKPYCHNVPIIDVFQSIDGTNLARGRLLELQSILKQLNFFEEAMPPALPEDTGKVPALGSRIFVVHGHDDGVKQEVAIFLGSLELDPPIFLDKEPNCGRTIIEKFEECGNSAVFAVVILTPDDKGRAVNEKDLKSRARQNVIFELGFFLGRLGRKRVAALYSEGVELPSDINGVLYIPLNDEHWQMKLAQEMKEIGLPIDFDVVLRQFG